MLPARKWIIIFQSYIVTRGHGIVLDRVNLNDLWRCLSPRWFNPYTSNSFIELKHILYITANCIQPQLTSSSCIILCEMVHEKCVHIFYMCMISNFLFLYKTFDIESKMYILGRWWNLGTWAWYRLYAVNMSTTLRTRTPDRINVKLMKQERKNGKCVLKGNVHVYVKPAPIS